MRKKLRAIESRKMKLCVEMDNLDSHQTHQAALPSANERLM